MLRTPCGLLPLTLLLSIPSAGAAQTFTSGYRIDQYTTDDGLPAHEVHDLVQTGDGFLWVATNGGLAWFDGTRFHGVISADPDLNIGRVGGLAAGQGDTLWFTPESGGVGVVSHGVPAQYADGGYIYDLEQGPDGALWIMDGGLSRYRDGRWQRLVAGTTLLYAFWTPRPRVWRDRRGVLWFQGTPGDTLFRVEHGMVSTQRAAQGVQLGNTVTGERFTTQPEGRWTLVVDDAGRLVARVPRDTTRTLRLVDRAGQVWSTSPTHVDVYRGTSGVPVLRYRLDPPQIVVTMIEDREGNVWVGTQVAGLLRFQPTAFTTIGLAEGLSTGQAMGVRPGRGDTVFAIDQDWKTFVVRNGMARPVPLPPGLRGGPVYDVVPMPDDWTWFVTEDRDAGNGYALIGTQRAEIRVRLHWADVPTNLLPDPHQANILWVRERANLIRLDQGAPHGPSVTGRWELEGAATGRGLLATRDGSLWLTGADSAQHGILWHLRGDSLTKYAAADGLPPSQLRDMYEGPDGALWIGTYGSGLVRWKDGIARRLTSRDGLPEDVASGMVPDGAGNLWFAGNRGLYRAALSDLEAMADGRATHVRAVLYGRADGIRNPEGSGRTPIRGPDGRLWFSTFGGAVVVDPIRAIALDSTPPRIQIASLTANGGPQAIGPEVRLPIGERQVEIGYRGVTTRRASQLTYEYRLAPLDDDWTPAGSRAVATWAALGPGTYEFLVRAINVGGIASAPATLTLVVPPRARETPWFAALTILTLLLIGWGVYRWQVGRLRRHEAELAVLVRDRTAELASETRRAEEALSTVAAQAEQLRTLDEAKSRFFANVSHEFRTPLSLILGPLEDVRDGREGRIPDTMRQKLDRVITNGHRLTRLVDQLLDVARLEAGALRLDLETRDLIPLLRRVAESFASMAERRGVDFRLSCPVGGLLVRFDPNQIDKVIANLLANAFKFTAGGGTVQLQASLEQGEHQHWAVIVVSDTGVGIPQDKVARIFERFYQADDSPQRAHEGTGIGLAIAKEVLDLHAGMIAVTSREGVGTTFTMRLPIARAEGQDVVDGPLTLRSRPELAITPAHGRPLVPSPDDTDDRTTILLVEDNAELRAWLREHLVDTYRILEASDGQQGLDTARAHLPDLVISDVMMPVMDGQTLCAELKTDPDTSIIPVILLTARASRQSRLDGLDEGADDYLTKPVDLQELQVRVRNLVALRRRIEERLQAPSAPLPVSTLRPGEDLEAGTRVFLERLHTAMAEHLGDETFQVDAMAQALAMSRATLYRRMEAALDQSPMDALWSYRLAQAAVWLTETDATVSEIAYGVGFKSVPHFSRRFRARFGRSPSEYRTIA